MSSDPTTQKPGRKHVSRACLECRRRHFKCDGSLPICNQCSRRNKECVYVESHRGGSRKKGVYKKKPDPLSVTDIEDLRLAPQSLAQIKQESDNLITQIYNLPCAKDQLKCTEVDCIGKEVVSGKRELDDTTSTEVRKRIKLQHSVKQLDCMILDIQVGGEDMQKIKNMDFELKYLNPGNLIDISTVINLEITENYYRYFHSKHPVLPPSSELASYLAVAPELSLIVKIIGDGQLLSLYAKDISLIQDRLLQVCNTVKALVEKDIISLQVVLLSLIVAHISGLHLLGKKFRRLCILLIEELEIHRLDGGKDGQLQLFALKRLGLVPRASIAELARRALWEMYFLDVIIGLADGKTQTKLSQMHITTTYPTLPSRDEFDYRGRSEAAKLVTESVKLNLEIMKKQDYEPTLKRLRAELLNWEMRLAEPLTYGYPELIHKTGEVNEGVHQAILLFNYAKIFVHRPFSYLWKIDSPQNPQCSEDQLEAKDMPTTLKHDHRATVETRKTIEAANLVVELLMDTNSTQVLHRTPLFACALALLALVHISAYIWIETVLESKDESLVSLSGMGTNELEIYAEYIKLALSAIYPISRHWSLLGKIAKHIRDSLQALRPKLYFKLEDLLPKLEVAMEHMAMLDSELSLVRLSSQVSPLNNLSPHSSITPNSLTLATMVKTDAGLSLMAEPMTAQQLFLMDTNNLVEGGDDFFEFNSLDWEPTTLNSGCDWIDRALADYFDDKVVA